MTAFFRNTNLGEYSADASDLGLSPGEWPKLLNAKHADGPTSGSEVLLRRTKIHQDREGEITHAEYVNFEGVGGNRYYVWND